MSLQYRFRSAAALGVGLTATMMLMASPPASAAKTKAAVPSVRLPLDQLGFPGYTVALMHAGASMATLHVLDDKHLLFTYSMRSLVPRLPGDDENDSDRLVAAEVVEIPSGKILERTQWHLHDHGRYLWSVGHGVFVLRSGDELSSFAPMQGLAHGAAFQRIALLHRPGHPEIVSGSPDGQIVTVELQRNAEGDEAGATAGDAPKRKHTTIEFYRLAMPSQPGEPVALRPAGAVGAPGLLRLALDGDGFLWADEANRNRWSVSFNEYEGKVEPLAAISSSCSPMLALVSRSEFLAMSCNGNDDSHLLTAFGFDGHETWQENFGDELQPPVFAAAPAAGRFAMSRLTASGSGQDIGAVALDDGTMNQEIRVYQTESGDLLLDLQCIPVARSPENFDLSPDGRTLAVLARSSIDLYRLPDLSARDRKDLADAETMTPPATDGQVSLKQITRPVEAETVSSEETTAPQPAVPAPSVSAGGAGSGAAAPKAPPMAAGRSAQTAADSPATAADAQEAPRKPPTLLAPGETPEFKIPNSSPQ